MKNGKSEVDAQGNGGDFMKITVFHGSPRKGNTYKATKIFMDEMSKCGDTEFIEFFLPKAIPEFCTGCQLCMGNPHDKCPHSQYISPILDSITSSDALIFSTPHHGGCSMSSGMKNLLDHLDFLTMTIAPRKEVFNKKAFIISTSTGSVAAIKPIKAFLKNWGINRVYSYGIKMYIDKWDHMQQPKQLKIEKVLRQRARKFYRLKKKKAYASSVFMYYIFRMIIKKYVGEGNYPYEYWKEHGFLTKRPY